MSRLFPILMCGLLLAITACSSDDKEQSPAEAPRTNMEATTGKSVKMDPVPAPDVAMETLAGSTINLAEQKGKVVLVNFWATWCPPCRKEIPDLIDLYSEFKAEGLMIVGVALDKEGASVVRPFVEKEKINYPIVIDTTRTLESQFDAMYGLPTTYVINTQGQVVRRVLGIFPTEKMKPKLREMLSEREAEATS